MTTIAALFLAQALAATNAVAEAGGPRSPSLPRRADALESRVADERRMPVATGNAQGGIRITSDRSDYDHKEGVAMFDGNVALDATVRGERYTMNAAQMFVFLEGTNDLKRVVALGGVVVTNGMRVGTCAKAVYAKAANRVTMHGGDDGTPAWLGSVDPKRRNDVSGRRITFWIDSQQVEVEGSTVNLDTSKLEMPKDGKGKDGLKGLFGR